MRIVEVALLLLPVLAYVGWRAAVARGLDGPDPRHLAALFATLAALAGLLVVIALHERLPPGRYVPAEVRNGEIVPGHAE